MMCEKCDVGRGVKLKEGKIHLQCMRQIAPEAHQHFKEGSGCCEKLIFFVLSAMKAQRKLLRASQT